MNRARALIVLLAGVVALIGMAFIWRSLPLRQSIEGLDLWIHSLGAWAPIVFCAAYVLAVMALVPASTVTLAAGFAFGLAGFPLALFAATCASACAFLCSRYVLASRVRRLIEGLPRSRAIYKAVSGGGGRVVFLLRLSPVMPFSVLNYALGTMELSFWAYISATVLGIIPGVALYVYLGALGEAAATSAPIDTARLALLCLGLLATLAVVVYVARRARAELLKAAPSAPGLAGNAPPA
jgi:uncharacterized membrane protein YdjX (TVP38/TMEM64 family)